MSDDQAGGTAMSVRERLLVAAHSAIETSGWTSVTMSSVAVAAGVSRQTVYNEFGTKHGLAEQLALRELERFLAVVEQQLESERDVVASIRAACEGVLELAESSVLIRTIVGVTDRDNDMDFLKILTTESGGIVEPAVEVVRDSIAGQYPDIALTPDELTVAVELVVRLVLSFVTRPSKAPKAAAADIAWMVELALKGAHSS